MTSLGKKIKNLRAINNMTQPELADASGVNQSYLSKIENDNVVPSEEILEKVAQAFQLSVEKILFDLDPEFIKQYYNHIPGLFSQIDQYKQAIKKSRRVWAIITTLLLVYGIFLLFAGYSNLFTNDDVYNYRANYEISIETTKIHTMTGETVPWIKKIPIMETFISDKFLGDIYTKFTEAGEKRIFKMYKKTFVAHWLNNIFKFLGVVFCAISIFIYYINHVKLISKEFKIDEKVISKKLLVDKNMLYILSAFLISIIFLAASIYGAFLPNVTYNYRSSEEISIPSLDSTVIMKQYTTHFYQGEYVANNITGETKKHRVYGLKATNYELNLLNKILLLLSLILLLITTIVTVSWLLRYSTLRSKTS